MVQGGEKNSRGGSCTPAPILPAPMSVGKVGLAKTKQISVVCNWHRRGGYLCISGI